MLKKELIGRGIDFGVDADFVRPPALRETGLRSSDDDATVGCARLCALLEHGNSWNNVVFFREPRQTDLGDQGAQGAFAPAPHKKQKLNDDTPKLCHGLV